MQDIPDFTPLNTTGANYTRLDIKEFKKKHYNTGLKNGINFLMVLSVSAFLLSASYYVQQTQFSSSSRAAGPRPSQTPLGDVFPKYYKDEVVPKNIITDLVQSAKAKDVKFPQTYAKERITKYYIYKDVLTENNIPLPTKDNIDDYIDQMEDLIKQYLLSKADFAFVMARFKDQPNVPELTEKYGDLEERAKAIMDTYTGLFNDPTYSPSQVVDAANKDEQLIAMNLGEENRYIEDYGVTQTVLIDDPTFQDFLFKQKEGEVSSPYLLKTTTGNPFAYVIVYPTSMTVRKFNSLNTIISEKYPYFKY